MIFLRDFYDEHRKVNTKHRWVWYFHIVSYAWILYVYLGTDAADRDASESSKIWIPLDIILTFNIALYQMFYNYMQHMMDQETCSGHHGHTPTASPQGVTEIGDTNQTPLLEGDPEAN